MAVSPDNNTIVSVSGDKLVKLWDLRSRSLEASLTGHTNPIFCVTISPNGKIIASGAQDKLLGL